MMDFVVRETRAVVEGPMAIVRFGTCGTLQQNVPIGSIVLADTSIMIRRNPDHWAGEKVAPYDFSKPISSDPKLSEHVCTFRPLQHIYNFSQLFNKMKDAVGPIVIRGTNATGDSFYSSQGIIPTSFLDID